MNNHDVINHEKWLKLIASNKRKEKIEHVALCILAIVLIAVIYPTIFFL